MLMKIAITVVMIILTTAIHAAGMMFIVRHVIGRQTERQPTWYRTNVFTVSGIVIVLFCISLAEAILWAVPYVLFNAIEKIEEAVYFSMVTYTTLGYGDVVLESHWRLLASFEAANGIVMFGWTTAIVMTVIRHIYFGAKTDG